MSEHSINSGKHVDRRIHLITAVLTLANFSICLHRSSRVYLFQQTQCLSYYLLTDPTKIGPNYFIDEMLCKNKDVQSPLSIIEGLDGFLGILPGRTPTLLDLMVTFLFKRKMKPRMRRRALNFYDIISL